MSERYEIMTDVTFRIKVPSDRAMGWLIKGLGGCKFLNSIQKVENDVVAVNFIGVELGTIKAEIMRVFDIIEMSSGDKNTNVGCIGRTFVELKD